MDTPRFRKSYEPEHGSGVNGEISESRDKEAQHTRDRHKSQNSHPLSATDAERRVGHPVDFFLDGIGISSVKAFVVASDDSLRGLQ
jgi:hypothetical protein